MVRGVDPYSVAPRMRAVAVLAAFWVARRIASALRAAPIGSARAWAGGLGAALAFGLAAIFGAARTSGDPLAVYRFTAALPIAVVTVGLLVAIATDAPRAAVPAMFTP